MASYSGLTDSELRTLLKLHKQSKGKVRCIDGHPGCGAAVNVEQDGFAPCSVELAKEVEWRTVGTRTVETIE